MTIPISAFIICLNEEDRIADAINSIKHWVDEVVVVDSGSTDKTVEIARELGANIVHNNWSGYGLQKRFAEEQCTHDWLLNLDADECVTVELAEEIQTLMRSSPVHNCYTIRIKDQFAHEKHPAPWAYSHTQIRLYNKQVARFSDSTVHDTVRPPHGCSVGKLTGIMAHRSLRGLRHGVIKSNDYSDMQRDDMIARGKHMPAWRLLTDFPLAFCKAYFLRQYILYGRWGFVLSMNYAWSRFIRVAKMVEHKLNKQG